MDAQQRKFFDLFSPLIKDYEIKIAPASQKDIDFLRSGYLIRSVPKSCINELSKFYEVFSEIPCIDSITIFPIGDTSVFEWWQDDKELWIGQRDMDIIRWKEGQFHLGDIGNTSYGEKYSNPSLLKIIEKGFDDWYPERYK